MKATILADGTLHVAPESDVEAYALDQWCRVNIDYRRADVHAPKICVDFNDYPGAMQSLTLRPPGEAQQ
ncbi:hypothetical protein BN2476_350249 [Paraburkholderia piptadeniae]|uniref:Uncharacterized protein n=1 Tax=Paraburkholderia piptadeniae TaxID=1701573 RepID=A0A1N7S8K5_9BURK|nr:hypothetical protein [Paraburkholderia piptadeniae]SIT43707.1 hypothetical protein BN2476_350249 [Paraburkholderia piptadeniae]